MIDEAYQRSEDTLEGQLLQTVKRCWTGVFSTTMRRVLPGHLTPQQLFVLAHLSHHDRTQPSELARVHHVGLSAMTGLVDGLVARGLVERRPDPHDRRVVLLAITAAGQALWAEAQAAVLETARLMIAPLDPAQRERLSVALTDLEQAMDRTLGAAEAPMMRTGHGSAPAAPEVRQEART